MRGLRARGAALPPRCGQAAGRAPGPRATSTRWRPGWPHLGEERGRLAAGPGRPAGRDVALGRQLHPVPARWPSRPGRCGRTSSTVRSWCETARSGQGSPAACGSPSAPPRRTTASSPPWTRACDDHHHADAIRAEGRYRLAATKETTIEVDLALDGTGTTEVDTGLPFFDHMVEPARPARRASTSTVAATGDLAGRRPPHGGGRRHRAGRGAWPRRWATRRASAASPRCRCPSTRRWSRWPWTCRAVRSWPTTSSSRRRPTAPRAPAVRPAAGRGVLAGLRHRRRHHAAHPAASTGKNTHHISRPRSRGWPAALRDAVRARGGRHPLHQGQAVTAASGGAVIAVLDYGIGNLRSAEKALQHVGADARLVADPELAAGADGVVLPGVGAFGRCLEALRVAAASTGAGRRRRRARCALPRHLRRASSCSTRAPTRIPAPRRSRSPPRRGPTAAGRGQAPADAVEPARARRRGGLRPAAGVPAPAWVYFVHSYAPELTADTVVHLRLRRAGDGHRPSGDRCGPPSSTPRSREPSGLGSWPTSWTPSAGPAGDGALPGHRPPRRRSRATDPGRLRPREPATGTRWPWPAGSPRRRALDPRRRPRRRPRGPPGQPSDGAGHRRGRRDPGADGRRCASEADVAELLDGGLSRVVLGTVALDDPTSWARWPVGSRAGWRWGWTTGGPRRAHRGGRPGLGAGQRPHRCRAARAGSTGSDWPRWSSPPSTATARWPARPRRAGGRAGGHLDPGHRLRRGGRGGRHRRPGRPRGDGGPPPDGGREPRTGWPGPSPARPWSTVG